MDAFGIAIKTVLNSERPKAGLSTGLPNSIGTDAEI